ncbi:MAG: hypothetical protein ACXACH_02305 [Candidatus Hermodarchaeia archaeon]
MIPLSRDVDSLILRITFSFSENQTSVEYKTLTVTANKPKLREKIMTKEPAQDEYQDIITYQTPPVKIIDDADVIALFYIPNYYVIIIALRQRPMTVRDLEQAFKDRAAKYGGIEPKSAKSIYRYLKTLEEAGLVVPAGQRVVPGKMVNETLFARTGQIFLLFNLKPEWWLTAHGKKIAKRIGKLLAFSFDAKPPPVKALQDLFKEYEMKRQRVLEELATKGDKETLSILASSTLQEHFRIEAYVGSFVSFIMQPELLDRLKQLMQPR